MAHTTKQHTKKYAMGLLPSILVVLIAKLTLAATAGEEISLELIHRDSIHSPLYPGNLTDTERIRRLVHFSDSRMHRLKSSIAASDMANIRPRVEHNDVDYMVKLSIGSPPQQVLLDLDTGSDLTWTQCEPCYRCFPQDTPKFKPQSSSTYHTLPCNHPLCSSFECVHGQCVYYTRTYGDHSYTRGVAATDHFTFPSSLSGHSETIEGVVFGCSRETSDDFYPRNRVVGGIIGMNPEPASFAMQMASRFRNRFSYCLVPSTDHQAFSYLRFGSDVPEGRGAQTTPLLRTNLKDGYYVELQDISVDGRRLNLPRGTFAIHYERTEKGGCTIDSGTAVTYLVTEAYNPVKTAVMKFFKKYKLTAVHQGKLALDLCYKRPEGFNKYPTMEFHFKGATLRVGRMNLFETIGGGSIFCFLMKPDESETILGASLQQNIRFIYDTSEWQLTFFPDLCARN